MTEIDQAFEEFGQFLRDRNLSAAGVGRRPSGQAQAGPPPPQGYAAGHWRWKDLYPALLQAGGLVRLGPFGPPGSAEMRTVGGAGARSRPITLGAQILMPGERTRAHRNMKNESRLIWQAPPGAVFVCDGEAFPMRHGDVIISPTWTFHDCMVPSSCTEPAIWFDGFDWGYSGLGEESEAFGLNEYLPPDLPHQVIDKPDGYWSRTLGRVGAEASSVDPLPPAHYPWVETQAALTLLKEREVEGDPFDGLHLMFKSPVDQGPTLPTMAWHVQLLRSREKTRAHRHNSTTSYAVFEGEGATVIEGERLEWSPGDIFVVPPWRWHHHENLVSTDAILFSIDDWPAMTKLGFYKKQEALP